MNKLAKTYIHLLKQYPASTKITSGAFLVGIGDIIAQKIVEQQPRWDPNRTARFAGIALCIITPCTRTWVDVILPKIVPIKPGQKVTTVIALKKVGCDMFIFGPVITTMFVGLNMFFSGEIERNKIFDKMCKDQPGIIAKAWCWWAPNQFLNFRFVPAHLQASYIQIAALVWNTFLSWVSHHNLKNDNESNDGRIKADKVD